MRQQRNIVLFGTNGTGKTTVMLNTAIEYLERNYRTGKRVLCCLPDDGERKYDVIKEITLEEHSLNNFSGIKKVFIEDKSDFEMIYKTYTAKTSAGFNGLCVFDDLGVLLNRRPEEVLKMLRRRRQMNMDMLWNFHGLTTDMPRSFWSFLTDIILFKTGDEHTDTMEKLPFDVRGDFEKMYFRVEKEAKTNPYYFERLKLRK